MEGAGELGVVGRRMGEEGHGRDSVLRAAGELGVGGEGGRVGDVRGGGRRERMKRAWKEEEKRSGMDMTGTHTCVREGESA